MGFKETIVQKYNSNEKKNAAIKAAVPEKYTHYVMDLERSIRISRKELDLDDDLKKMGCYVNNGATYLPLKSAYFTVMGKVAQFNDWVSDNGYSSRISDAQFAQVGSIHSCRKTVMVFDSQGRIIKEASGTSSVGFGGTGVDSTNPLENAETSALGRALTYLGMGTQVENIASAEEMDEAERREERGEQKEPDAQAGRYVVSDLQHYEKGGQSLAQLTVVSQDTGETSKYWVKDSLAIQAKILLQKNDTIEAVPSLVTGNKGPVNTFLSFQKLSYGEEGLACNW